MTHRKKHKQYSATKESRSCREYRRKSKYHRRKTRMNARKFQPITEESEELPRPRQPITLMNFFPKNFQIEIASCHAIGTTKEDVSPSYPVEVATKPEELPSFDVNDFLSLLREIKDTIIEMLKNDDVSTIAAPQTKCVIPVVC